MYEPVELPQLLDEMDEHGVEKAILMDNLTKPSVTARKFVDANARQVRAGHGRRQPAAADAVAAGTQRDRPRPAGGVHRCGTQLLGRWPVPAERRRLLPAVHQVRGTRAAVVRQHRPARAADPRRGAEPDPSGPRLRAIPRAQALHDPRRGPVVGHRDPIDDQVREPAPDDVSVVTEAAAGQPAALHADPRTGQGDLRVGLAGAQDASRGARGVGTGPAGRSAGELPLQQRTEFFFGPREEQ